MKGSAAKGAARLPVFTYVVPIGSAEHRYVLARQRWRAACEAWLAAKRPRFLRVEVGLPLVFDDEGGA